MKMNISQLRGELEHLLKESGFPEEHYIIKTNNDSIAVMFDKKEAVDYFKGDFDESSLARDCIFEYKREGKRHAAYIYNW
jgi:hypothetical protein